ncbi:hypothetical protein GH714_013890 [Hevea brasiliensis]|uniref:Uncharacterized protein n=1 Tax=Hevea brasiliensis TaxID=3981 RepID=A0A6A6LGD6_HEVBR|nr:hypothetical protein GH714_013890 [Hevea brasiliensis]
MAKQQSQQHRLLKILAVATDRHWALIGFIIFAYAVTDKGSGRPVTNRGYLDYYLQDYSGWLEERVASHSYWSKISSCIRDSKICAKMGVTINGVPETADMFYQRKLSPIQSGCCKPPTDCGFTYVNETVWTYGGGLFTTLTVTTGVMINSSCVILATLARLECLAA